MITKFTRNMIVFCVRFLRLSKMKLVASSTKAVTFLPIRVISIWK